MMLAGMALAGCGGGKEFPLSVGRSWSYMVRGTFASRVEEVKVLRKVPVDGVMGYELGGTMGQSRLAWKDGVLVAQQLPNATFNPSIPLVVAGEEKARRDWKGLIGAFGKGTPATATLIQEQDPMTVTGKTIKTTRSTLTILTPERKIELITWFEPGVGPIKQEQRNNETLEVAFESINAA
ncbi:MAG: hypothetical protein QOJ65_493 [Fimbriimonadaceae bacterium]|nr:hypothetical protein [Fimbriimonadaceae bacterium]